MQRLAGALVDLGAVLVVVEAVLALEVLVDLGLDDAVGHGHVDGLEEVLEHLVAGLDALLVLLGLLGLRRDVGAQLLEGVELGGELGEVVVELGQLADLDRLHGDGALGVVALVVATGEQCGELLGLLGRHADEGLVEAVEHGFARAHLVGDAGHRVDLVVADAGPGRSIETKSPFSTARSTPFRVPNRSCSAMSRASTSSSDGLGFVDLDGDAAEVVRQLDLGAHVDLDGELEVLAVLVRARRSRRPRADRSERTLF